MSNHEDQNLKIELKIAPWIGIEAIWMVKSSFRATQWLYFSNMDIFEIVNMELKDVGFKISYE